TNARYLRPPWAFVRIAGACPCAAIPPPSKAAAPVPTAATPAVFRTRRRETFRDFDDINTSCASGIVWCDDRGNHGAIHRHVVGLPGLIQRERSRCQRLQIQLPDFGQPDVARDVAARVRAARRAGVPVL